MTIDPPPADRPSPIATLFPGYFALVMSTGIVAVAASQQDIDWLAEILYVIAVGAFMALVVLHVLRLARHWDRFVADLTDHAKGFSFLTAVAATNVVAAASIVVHQWWGLAWGLWWASLGLWAGLLYPTLIAVVIGRSKPGLETGINGTWFLLTVSTESIAVVAGLLLARSGSDVLAFVALAAFVLGGVLYVIVMTMVFLRWTFQPLDPAEADPPAWIAAGAVAITTLAGSNLLLAAQQGVERLDRLSAVLEAGAVTAWVTSTFWFPLMIAIGVWRHIVRRVPLRYHPSFWAMVFPLGMYGAATFRMLAAVDLTDLDWLPKLVLAVALLAWAVTFTGMLRHLLGRGGNAPSVDRRSR
ncbi:tellurite resistance/C4-dicarboxylate transporter family protein [Desertimonas flava]|uniref:tellurite resistance/C4-dicarboxylate transporter family protein n=1 Tax=Desertimonas flava TaxID=2064846 RepID=UPI000E345827|nr:tellurite resistance/C4-dicarboxylate transporter family protein [Desertimonas flava]